MSETKLCPFCGEEIKSIAVKCKHCGEWFDDRPAEQGPASGSHSGISSGHHSGSLSGSPGSPPGTPSGSHPSTPSGHTPLTGVHLVNHALGDRYEILEEIGRGGMATVYKAIQKSLERTVALKVVHQNLLHDTEFVARFHREAQLCASLNHPNIVHVYDEGEVSGVHFMAMEYLEGTDLHRLIRSRGRLTPEQTLQYLLPVAEALDYAHAKGYIHRDIKSANIFITGSGRVVLMDFGIAHAAAGTQLTRAGTVIGTPEYMSPEQAEGKKVDHRTDLYSLGVVMYECLAGRVPFKGENAMSTIFQLTRNEPDDKPLGQTPVSIRQLVTALLCKKPENRPASARSVAEGIKLLQKGKAWSVVKPPLRPDDKRKTTDHTIRVGGGGTGGNEPPSAHPGASRGKKVSPVVWVLLLIGVLLGGVLINHMVTENRQQQEAQLEQSAWQQAERRNTIEAYNQYLREYPGGRYAELAKAAIASKMKAAEEEAERDRDRRAWNTARQTNSKASYEAYLRDFPRGQFANQARNAMERITKEEAAARDRQAWDSARQTNRKASYEAYLRNYPRGQFANQARSEIRRIDADVAAENDRQAWNTAQTTNTISSYEAYLRDFEQGQYVKEALKKIKQLKDEPLQQEDPRALFPTRTEKADVTQSMEGIEYNLTGRRANYLPLPDYTTLATGRVVVQITVNRQGQVIRATAGARGTTTADRKLHQSAEKAARNARFDMKSDAPEEQTGTITYNFIRL